MFRRHAILFWAALMVALLPFLASCDKDKDSYPTAPETCYISVVFPVNGIGDRGFNDNVYSGIFRIKEFYEGYTPINIRVLIPEADEQASQYIAQWFDTKTDNRRLLILVGDNYSSEVAKYCDKPMQSKSDVLLLDSRNIFPNCYTRYISLYGMSYFAGMVASMLDLGNIVTIMGNPIDYPPLEASQAFIDGYASMVDDTAGHVFREYLATEAGYGYNMPDKAFNICLNHSQQHDAFIFPVCGYSSQGVYSFLRTSLGEDRYYSGLLTCGLDGDQSMYSYYVMFSLVKRYDVMLEHFVYDWVDEKIMPSYQWEGLGTEYAQFLFSDTFWLFDDNEMYFIDVERIAISAEQQYYRSDTTTK